MEKNVKEFVRELIQDEQSEIDIHYRSLCETTLSDLTPIEQLMGLALHRACRMSQTDFFRFNFWPQKQIGRYRVDFFIEAVNIVGDFAHEIQLVVECDGHNFHEKTREQAASDKAREREIQSLGFPMIRFTGSEIWRDPKRCAAEVWTFIEKACQRALRTHFAPKEKNNAESA